WVHDDATLGASEGNIDHRALPCHPHCQRSHLIKRDISIEADAAFGWSAGDIVLYAVAREHLHAAVIHAHGKVDGQLAFGSAQNRAHLLAEVEEFGGSVELGDGNRERVEHFRLFNCHRLPSSQMAGTGLDGATPLPADGGCMESHGDSTRAHERACAGT